MSFSLRTKFIALAFALVLLTPGASLAQTFSLGADLMSRYVWRGYDFGESFSVQPALTFGSGGFEIGSWASYSISADGVGATEHDLWLGYTVETDGSGSFSFGVTDYYFPAGADEDGSFNFFNFDGDGDGAHYIEPYASYTGPESFPLTLYGAVFVHNDPDNSIYLEASVPFSVEEVELGLTAGAIAGESAFYGTDGFALVNLGLSASKDLKISDALSLPVSVAYILNPDIERTYLVFGIGISL